MCIILTNQDNKNYLFMKNKSQRVAKKITFKCLN